MKHVKLISAQTTWEPEDILAIIDRAFTFILDMVEATSKDKNSA